MGVTDGSRPLSCVLGGADLMITTTTTTTIIGIHGPDDDDEDIQIIF